MRSGATSDRPAADVFARSTTSAGARGRVDMLAAASPALPGATRLFLPRRAGGRRSAIASRRVGASGATRGGDALGGQDFIYSQRSGVSEELFKGRLLGVDADVATGDLRVGELRAFGNVVGDYHVPERFRDRFAVHVAKNLLADAGRIAGRVPLVLGVWGGKGCGKSFNLELCCRDLGVFPIVVSAGELEDPVAGEPGALLRRRYTRRRGRVPDAPARGRPHRQRHRRRRRTIQGRCGHRQQSDRPGDTHEPVRRPDARERRRGVALGRPRDVSTSTDSRHRKRHVATVRALTRSGRMDLWMWEPTREEMVEMVHRTLRDAEGATGYGGVKDARALVAAFPNQPLDFFGAARSKCADDAVRRWIADVGVAEMRETLVGCRAGGGQGGGARGSDDDGRRRARLPRQDLSLR